MIEFSLFGVPIRIQPMHWIGLLLLAFLSAQGLTARDRNLFVLFFILAGFVSILAHELGHALVGRKKAGGMAQIELVFLGGYAYHHGARFTKSSLIAMILAGPGMNFVLFFLMFLVGMAWFGPSLFSAVSLLNLGGIPFSDSLLSFLGKNGYFPRESSFESLSKIQVAQEVPAFILLQIMLMINFWWGLLNLIPVWPLDGGKFIEQFFKSPRFLHQFCFWLALGFIGLFLWLGAFLPVAFFGQFAFLNYQCMRASRY